jgi:hypothetical protein
MEYERNAGHLPTPAPEPFKGPSATIDLETPFGDSRGWPCIFVRAQRTEIAEEI